jgi:hypothetical protein
MPFDERARTEFHILRDSRRYGIPTWATSVEECAADAAECIGEPLGNPRVDPADVDIEGDDATITLVGDELTLEIEAIREDDIWKLDGIRATSDEIADGVETVDLALNEFAFEFDAEDQHLASGKFAFRISNEGEQIHEAVLFQLPAEGDLLELLGAESPDLAFLGVKFPLMADDEVDWAVPDLTAGRYALVCFLPDTDDPEGTPHAFKGMTAEFTVQ